MRFCKKEFIPNIVEVSFKRVASVLPWMFPMNKCDMCGVNFDTLDYKTDIVIIAEDSKRRFHFCEKCWNSDKDFVVDALPGERLEA